MHIRDLHVDVELDKKALSAVRGGTSIPAGGQTQHPGLPTFGGDWTQLNADIKGYFGTVRAGSEFPAINIGAPATPEIATPNVATPVAPTAGVI